MKKIATVLAVIATLSGNSALAQTSNNSQAMGQGAQAGAYSTQDNFAWGIGLGALAVIGTVVGLAAGTAASNSNSFSH